MVGLGRTRERARQAELLQRRLGHALDAGRIRRLAAGVRVVGEAADRDRVLRRAVARDPDQVQLQGLAELVEPRGDDRLLVDAVVGAGRLEEAKFSSVRDERRVDAAARGRDPSARGERVRRGGTRVEDVCLVNECPVQGL